MDYAICKTIKTRLGKDVYLGAWPKGELVVGDHSYIGRWTIVLAHQSVNIGSDCRIAPGCSLMSLLQVSFSYD